MHILCVNVCVCAESEELHTQLSYLNRCGYEKLRCYYYYMYTHCTGNPTREFAVHLHLRFKFCSPPTSQAMQL